MIEWILFNIPSLLSRVLLRGIVLRWRRERAELFVIWAKNGRVLPKDHPLPTFLREFHSFPRQSARQTNQQITELNFGSGYYIERKPATENVLLHRLFYWLAWYGYIRSPDRLIPGCLKALCTFMQGCENWRVFLHCHLGVSTKYDWGINC